MILPAIWQTGKAFLLVGYSEMSTPAWTHNSVIAGIRSTRRHSLCDIALPILSYKWKDSIRGKTCSIPPFFPDVLFACRAATTLRDLILCGGWPTWTSPNRLQQQIHWYLLNNLSNQNNGMLTFEYCVNYGDYNHRLLTNKVHYGDNICLDNC